MSTVLDVNLVNNFRDEVKDSTIKALTGYDSSGHLLHALTSRYLKKVEEYKKLSKQDIKKFSQELLDEIPDKPIQEEQGQSSINLNIFNIRLAQAIEELTQSINQPYDGVSSSVYINYLAKQEEYLAKRLAKFNYEMNEYKEAISKDKITTRSTISNNYIDIKRLNLDMVQHVQRTLLYHLYKAIDLKPEYYNIYDEAGFIILCEIAYMKNSGLLLIGS